MRTFLIIAVLTLTSQIQAGQGLIAAVPTVDGAHLALWKDSDILNGNSTYAPQANIPKEAIRDLRNGEYVEEEWKIVGTGHNAVMEKKAPADDVDLFRDTIIAEIDAKTIECIASGSEQTIGAQTYTVATRQVDQENLISAFQDANDGDLDALPFMLRLEKPRKVQGVWKYALELTTLNHLQTAKRRLHKYINDQRDDGYGLKEEALNTDSVVDLQDIRQRNDAR